MTLTKMSATKLIIQKFTDDDDNFKFLHVTIFDRGNNTCETNFSEWTDGKSLQKKKNAERTSRLVVKLVSGEEFKLINLDSCARQVDNTEMPHFSTVANSSFRFIFDNLLYDGNQYNDEVRRGSGDEVAVNNKSTLFKNINKQSLQDLNGFYHNSEKYSSNSEQLLSPLEKSLERVKENNARIMENIHMLNRTLDYTKKKEILDMVCPKTMRSNPCNVCGKCFVYETGLRRHYSMRHAIADMQPRWQVVWTCIQCFQVWPRQDLALQHSSMCCSSNSTDCVREIKTSLLLQCEFCEKVFTSIPRLLRHSKLHNTANNYECNACGLAFLSYKTAEQHWLLCPWLKTCYIFSLAKMLLCNACDRKFRSYEQLYNHRYKVGHFMMKTHQGSAKSLGISVYQCEMCGLWYSSVSLLTTHRGQFHPHDNGTQMDKSIEECHSDYMSLNDEYYGIEIQHNQMYNN